MSKIIITAYHGFLKREILTWEFWYDREKATYGWYSRFWKMTKHSLANDMKADKHWIRCKVKFKECEPYDMRTVLSLPSGFKISMPDDMTDVDYEILQLHLQALKLSAQ